jgi:lipopolysaccharide-induced tumor necrosis factor-alpha factor
MENNKETTVPIAPATAAESIVDSAEPATGPKTMPADGANSPAQLPTASPTALPTISPTAAEETLAPEPTTTTTRTLPGDEPMAIIPAESGPPPQYDEYASRSKEKSSS